jgi:hypothetical protein
LKLWHINGAEKRISPRQALFSFYELNQPTETEKALVRLQDATIFSSSYAKNSFAAEGLKIENVPLGFDSDFFKTDKVYLQDKIHFVIMGKFERRKHTDKIIKLWAKKYGNNPKYQLSCSIVNPFLDKEILKKLLAGYKALAWNINILPYVSTNSEVNDVLNSADIDLSGLSGAEGWGLPAFNATCLGKWSVVLNATSHLDWATKDNSILVQPSNLIEAYDGTFFKKGQEFNQGEIYDFNAVAWLGTGATLVRYEDVIANLRAIDTPGARTYFATLLQHLGLEDLPPDWQERVRIGADPKHSGTARENLTGAGIELPATLPAEQRALVDYAVPGLRQLLGYK